MMPLLGHLAPRPLKSTLRAVVAGHWPDETSRVPERPGIVAAGEDLPWIGST